METNCQTLETSCFFTMETSLVAQLNSAFAPEKSLIYRSMIAIGRPNRGYFKTAGGRMNRSLILLAIAILMPRPSLLAQAQAPATYTLKPSPKTVAWGYYDAKAAPVLRVKSGDTVEIQTLITNSPKRLEEAGLPAQHVEPMPRGITHQGEEKRARAHPLSRHHALQSRARARGAL